MILHADRAFAHTGQDDPTDALAQNIPILVSGAGRVVGTDRDRLALLAVPAVLGGQHALEAGQHGVAVPVQVVDDGVGAGVEGVGGPQALGFGVERLDGPDGGPAHVIQVEDGRLRVQAGGVEAVAVTHGDAREGVEVAGRDGGFHRAHACGHDRVGSRSEQARRLHRRLHPRRAAHPLFGRAHHQDQRPHLGPVAPWCHQPGHAVEPVVLRAVVPRHIAAQQAAARRPGPLARDERQLRRRLR